jgi:cytochrome d ubiquinol oxidase subunit II
MIALQYTWFILLGVLFAGYAILDGFDLGVGLWYPLTKKDEERRGLLRAIGPVWDGNEVWLLTGGGALFAAFSPVYATVFSGFYLALLLVLLGLILRATGIEFRNKVASAGWRKSWDLAFFIGSLLPALLFGVALGNLVRGLELDSAGNYVGGFIALLNPYALAVGLAGLAMFATHGALYLTLKTEGELRDQARTWAARAWIAYLTLFLVCAAWSLAVYQRGHPVWAAVAALAALFAIAAIGFFNRAGASLKAFICSALSIVALFCATGASLFPNLVPASNDPALSLTIFNASSSQNTLTVMLIFALIGMPVVIGYTIFIYRTFAGPIKAEDINQGY